MFKKNKLAPLCVLGCTLIASAGTFADELFLEGVSILGSKKTASVVYNEQPMSLHQGDNVGEWTIADIEERSIKLQDKAGEIHTLELHSSLNKAGEDEVNPTEELSDVKSGAGFQPKIIKDEDIPEGHRRIRTPFGDVLIKDNPAVDLPKK